MTVTFNVTGDGGGPGNNNNGRRVLVAKTDSLSNVNNNNNGQDVASANTGKASVLSVRRVLFGPPADPAETRAWLDRQLYAASAADSRAWNFDFVNERPLRDSPADRYAWERVCPPEEQQGHDEVTAANSTSPQKRRMAAGSKQRQSKVTDFMSKTKKRSYGMAASLRSNKKALLDDGLVAPANKRSRRSLTTTAI